MNIVKLLLLDVKTSQDGQPEHNRNQVHIQGRPDGNFTVMGFIYMGWFILKAITKNRSQFFTTQHRMF